MEVRFLGSFVEGATPRQKKIERMRWIRDSRKMAKERAKERKELAEICETLFKEKYYK
ncbi:hypothetical protein RHG08_15555 [Clostridioides difficile]|nr:hypothetical protein [Clostridioides difficile]